jgi:hypothetical protein
VAGVELQMPAVLLTDEHDERRSTDASGGERADAVPEAGGGVEDDQSGPAAYRPSGRDPDDGCLVQPQDKLESTGRSASSEISVDPGFEIVVSPCRRRTSNASSRTVAAASAEIPIQT